MTIIHTGEVNIESDLMGHNTWALHDVEKYSAFAMLNTAHWMVQVPQ